MLYSGNCPPSSMSCTYWRRLAGGLDRRCCTLTFGDVEPLIVLPLSTSTFGNVESLIVLYLFTSTFGNVDPLIVLSLFTYTFGNVGSMIVLSLLHIPSGTLNLWSCWLFYIYLRERWISDRVVSFTYTFGNAEPLIVFLFTPTFGNIEFLILSPVFFNFIRLPSGILRLRTCF